VDWCQTKRLQKVSDGCREFMSILLVKDPDVRPLAIDALSQQWLATADAAAKPQVVSARTTDKRRIVKRQGASQLPTECDSVADAGLANLGSCLQTQGSMRAGANGEVDACVPIKTCSTGSICSLRSYSSGSLSSLSVESSQDEGDEEQLGNNTLTSLPFPEVARPENSAAAPQRSKRLVSMLLDHGRAVSRVMCSGTPRASMQHCVLADSETHHGDAVTRNSVSLRSNRVARTRKLLTGHGGKACTEDLPVLRARRWSLSDAGGRKAGSAGNDGSILEVEESGRPLSAHTKPRQIQCDAMGMANTFEELPIFREERSIQARRSRLGRTLTPLARKAPDSLQQMELPHTGMSQSKSKGIPGHPERGAVGDSKTLEELPTFARKARR